MHSMSCDVLIVGGGGAALRAAIAAREVAPDLRVLLVTKGRLGASGVTATACSDRMAFHATLPTTEPGGPDAWTCHADDIYRIGGRVSDADLATILAQNSAAAFFYLDRLGVPFVRRADGTVDQFVTDGSRYARACYTGPYTANHIHAALLEQFRRLGIDSLDETIVTRLLLSRDRRRVAGALLVAEGSGERTLLSSKTTILATGGAGAAFAVNVFPGDCTGDGLALAYHAGAQLVNLEFIQIGLSSLTTKLACSGSMLRALPRLVNDRGEEFLRRYLSGDAPPPAQHSLLFDKGASWPVSLEEPSHRIDIAVHCERQAGRRVYLDYARNPTGFIWASLDPGVRSWYAEVRGLDLGDPNLSDSPLGRVKRINAQAVEWLRDRGIDLDKGDGVEIAPAVQHFQGGVKIRTRAETSLPGLYAAGEVAGGQHGANRPGGNALLDCQVFGRIAGESAAMEAQTMARCATPCEKDLEAAMGWLDGMSREAGLRASQVRESVSNIASRELGVVRTAQGLRSGIEELRALKLEGVAVDEHGLTYAVETSNLVDVVDLLLRAAAMRDESRGPHLRFDSAEGSPCESEPHRLPAPVPRDDVGWQRYIVVRREGDEPRLTAQVPVQPTR